MIVTLICWLKGHDPERKVYDGNGKRVELSVCRRCRQPDPTTMVISPRNRRIRRAWARQVAKEIAR